MVLIWWLSSHPGTPPGATGPAIEHSYAAMLGHAIAPVLALDVVQTREELVRIERGPQHRGGVQVRPARRNAASAQRIGFENGPAGS